MLCISTRFASSNRVETHFSASKQTFRCLSTSNDVERRRKKFFPLQKLFSSSKNQKIIVIMFKIFLPFKSLTRKITRFVRVVAFSDIFVRAHHCFCSHTEILRRFRVCVLKFFYDFHARVVAQTSLTLSCSTQSILLIKCFLKTRDGVVMNFSLNEGVCFTRMVFFAPALGIKRNVDAMTNHSSLDQSYNCILLMSKYHGSS